ncbi:uncharacterized protein BJ212DRAFT_1486171 [Suillus subaureus]|uniref:MULE transposase domain-containing protein n=1 Tax=Suillus subaureus TaxID=48587 RepID=A0A9P7DXY3_9AGAM|nr:uncharacterized protein BJ212DRAFT_1486171 [Suillus subaureus]KAG1805825.1 hypothetical protein BJ212DRAFT_1486171 [Suillus subaureus]
MENICEAVNSIPAKRRALVSPQDAPAPKQALTSASSKGEEEADDDDDAPELEDAIDDKEDTAAEEAYQRMKKHGDQDRDNCKSLKKDEQSADLTIIFIPEKGRINPHTQENEDGWWCEPGDPFLSITAHYIGSLIETPQEWELRMEQLAFTPINGNHSGANIRRILIETIDKHMKVGWFTADNTTNNDTAIATVAADIDPSGEKWSAVEHQVHCMEHALHLAAKHFIEEVTPTPVSTLHKKAAEDSDDEDEEFDVADTIGKALALVMQLADDSDEVPKLQGGKLYMGFQLSPQEWKDLELMYDVLQEPADAQQTFLVTHKPTVWRTIPVLEFLQEMWQTMANSSKFSSVSMAIEAGVNNLQKWYHKTDDTSIYFICLALDPNYKVAYTKVKWDPDHFDEGMMCFNKVCLLHSVTKALMDTIGCATPSNTSWMIQQHGSDGLTRSLRIIWPHLLKMLTTWWHGGGTIPFNTLLSPTLPKITLLSKDLHQGTGRNMVFIDINGKIRSNIY